MSELAKEGGAIADHLALLSQIIQHSTRLSEQTLLAQTIVEGYLQPLKKPEQGLKRKRQASAGSRKKAKGAAATEETFDFDYLESALGYLCDTVLLSGRLESIADKVKAEAALARYCEQSSGTDDLPAEYFRARLILLQRHVATLGYYTGMATTHLSSEKGCLDVIGILQKIADLNQQLNEALCKWQANPALVGTLKSAPVQSRAVVGGRLDDAKPLACAAISPGAAAFFQPAATAVEDDFMAAAAAAIAGSRIFEETIRSTLGLTPQNISGAGLSCQFRAIATQLLQIYRDAFPADLLEKLRTSDSDDNQYREVEVLTKRLRQLAITEIMTTDPRELEEFIITMHSNAPGDSADRGITVTIEAYCERMAKPGERGDEITAKALSSSLNLPLLILDSREHGRNFNLPHRLYGDVNQAGDDQVVNAPMDHLIIITYDGTDHYETVSDRPDELFREFCRRVHYRFSDDPILAPAAGVAAGFGRD